MSDEKFEAMFEKLREQDDGGPRRSALVDVRVASATYEIYEGRDLGRLWTYLAVRSRLKRTVGDARMEALKLRPDMADQVRSELAVLAETYEHVFDLCEVPVPDFKIRWEQIHRTDMGTTWGEPEVHWIGRSLTTVMDNCSFIQRYLLEGESLRDEPRVARPRDLTVVFSTPVQATERLGSHCGFVRVKRVRASDDPASVYYVEHKE